jgi:hypothetical protein
MSARVFRFPIRSGYLRSLFGRSAWTGVLLLGAALAPAPAHATDPSADQQYWLELINRMRRDPEGELARLVYFSAPGVWATTKSDDPTVQFALDYYNTSASALQTEWNSLASAPPLAWSSLLSTSATAYSNLMVQQQEQSHTLDGLSLADRIQSGGYTSQYLEVGESLFAATENVLHGHSAFAIDWGDSDSDPNNGFGSGIQTPALHREVMMDRLFKELGIGFQSVAIPPSNGQAPGPLVVTQHFASQYRYTGAQYVSDTIITGVVHTDDILADAFYTPGEGVANTMLQVWDTFTTTLVTTGLTNSAGGFNIVTPDLILGRTYAVRLADGSAPDVLFTASATVENYGPDVTVYDNAYASFIVVPEPGTALLSLLACLFTLPRRRHAS